MLRTALFTSSPLLFTGLALITLACASSQSRSSSASTTNPASAMTSTTQPSATATAALLQAITLVARQEMLPPLGTATQSARPISFASVFLTLKNPSDRPQALEQLKVEVVAVDDGTVQLSSEPQTLQLQPLENAVQDIQLNHREGYGTTGKVKAIATYRIDGQTHRLESVAVEIR